MKANNLATLIDDKAKTILETHRRPEPLNTPTDDAMETAGLLQSLARVLRGTPVVNAFGAPADWTLGTPIANAIAAQE